MALPQIAFVGSGNLAWHLAPALDSMGYVVREVYSTTPSHATLLSQRLYHATVRTSLDFSNSTATIFVIAVKDDSIQAVARDIILPERAILLHTSGSAPLSILEFAATPHIGIFYPLQTFSKTRKVSFKDIPIFFEGNTEEAENEMKRMAKVIGAKPKKTNAVERKTLHVAAVFASNFANHMFAISHELLQKRNLNPALLMPLMMETVAKEQAIGPHKAQTGPAMRGDMKIIRDHLKFLDDDPLIADMYKRISQHIINTYVGG